MAIRDRLTEFITYVTTTLHPVSGRLGSNQRHGDPISEVTLSVTTDIYFEGLTKAV